MKAVIFDMDGTMVDNMMVHHRAWQQHLRKLGLELNMDEVMQKVHGINEEIIERLMPGKFTLEQRRSYSYQKEEAYRQAFKHELKLIEGLPDLLRDLREHGIPMAIASAAPPENVDFAVDGLNIRSLFSVILHARDVENGKPDPEIYQKAAAQLGFSEPECLVFEDSPTGAMAASRAGCPIVVVTTTHEPAEFTHITGIIEYIKNFNQLDIQKIQEL